MTNICQTKCAKSSDCGQGLTCDKDLNTCYEYSNPVVLKKLEAKAKALKEDLIIIPT